MRMARTARRVLGAAAIALLFAAPTLPAATYRWVDEDGNVQFSDRPPEHVPPGGYEGPKPPTVGEAQRARQAQERARRRSESPPETADAPEATPAPAEPPAVESRYSCEEARRFLAQFSQPAGDLFVPGPDGSYRKATPEDMARIAADWREAVRLLCPEEPAAAAGGS